MELAREFMAVGLVLLLAAGTAWRFGRGRSWTLGKQRSPGGRLKLETVGRLPLTPQHTLHVVRVGGRAMVVASHGAGCTLIATLGWTEFESGGEDARAS